MITEICVYLTYVLVEQGGWTVRRIKKKKMISGDGVFVMNFVHRESYAYDIQILENYITLRTA